MIGTLGIFGFVAIAVGAAAGLATLLWARRGGHAEAKFWRQALVVMQVIYLLFALVARSSEGALREGIVLVLFWAVALAGARFSTWFVALGILAHGFWDLRHLVAVEGYVVPFYAEACVGCARSAPP